jgi:subtilisin family serine protease
MFRFFLAGALCLLCAGCAVAQQQHFYSHEKQINLTASNTDFIVVAANPALLVAARQDNVKQYQRWPHARHAVLSTTRALTPAEVITSLGFDTDDVQVSPAYTLADGFKLYPTATVVFKPGDKNDLPAIERALAGIPVKKKDLRFGTWRYQLEDLNQVFAAASTLRLSGLVEFAQPDFYAALRRYQDPLYPDQFQLHNNGQNIDGYPGMIDADCNAPEAWSVSLGSAAVTVAVLDDGLEDHEDLRDAEGQPRYVAGFTPVNGGNGNAGNVAAHGMACAGIIAASHNDIGVRGLAPYVRLLSVNIFAGGETTQDVADGITWAVNQGADVLSNSWGYSSCELTFDNIDNALSEANANGRGGLGSLVVFASGNDYYDCVSYPGNHPDVVAVGAFSSMGERSDYSNYGPGLDLMAGSDNVRAPGASVRTTDRMGTSGYSNGNYVSDFGGTSAACPVVAGVAALVLGYNPTLTATELKNILYTTAKDMGPTGFDPVNGYGRVDAYAALMLAGSGGPLPTCSDGFQNGLETGTDCGGAFCEPCASGPVTCMDFAVELHIDFDNYPAETSWAIFNEAGQSLFASTNYGNEAPRAMVTESLCLPAGCYTFLIRDLYGDGICCGFGSGSYTLTQGGTVLASGGEFGQSESTNFCVGGDSEPDTIPPNPVPQLSAENPTPTGIDLRWTATSDNVGVTGYVLFLDGEVTDTVTETAFRYDNLTACTDYDFGVAAFDAAGNHSDTTTTSGTTTGCPTVDDELAAAFFERGWDGWTDGGGDCYRYRGGYSYEGEYAIRLRDNSGAASAMTSPTLNLRGRREVNLSFYFYPNSMEAGESFLVRFHDGYSWRTVARYVSGANFQNGTFYQASLSLSAERYVFSNLNRFRIQCNASSNADQLYIDQVTIGAPGEGGDVFDGPKGNRIRPVTADGGIMSTSSGTSPLIERDVTIYPNPASRLVTVVADDVIETLTLYAADGRRVKHQVCGRAKRVSLSVADLPTGVYLLSVATEEEVMVERLVVQEE